MRRLSRSWIPVAALAAALGGGPAASAASFSAAQPSRLISPKVEICGTGPAVARPTSVILTCADSGELATHLTWSSWTSSRATAAGTITWRACASMCAKSTRWARTTGRITLSDPVREPGHGMLFSKLELHVTGKTPAGFLRTAGFSEAPAPVTRTRPGKTPAGRDGIHPDGSTLGYAQIEGFWQLAGGPGGGTAQIAAAITGAESSFLPGIIQPGVDYCGAGADRAGWGLWQITCGNSVPGFGTDFQILDPWNNAEAAVAKYNADVRAGLNGFDPWSTYTSGAYKQFLQNTGADTNLTDPGEYVQINGTPAGTPASPAPDPGSTYGPPLPGGLLTAFQANTGNLWLEHNGNAADQKLGLAVGTSPALAAGASGGSEVAFQANTGFLWTESNGTGSNRKLGMMPGTSPAIAALSTGGYEIAFQSAQGELWLVSASGTATDQKLGMMSGTSPAITALPGGGFEVAFQANTGNLWIDNGSSSASQKLGMARGSSPAITAVGSGYQIAFQANTGNLWTDTNGAPANLKLGMLTGTSPAITDGGSGIVIAFQANTGFLWTVTRNGSANTELGMMAGSSPAVTVINSGTEIAFQANTGNLWFYLNGNSADQKLGMMGSTTPAISSLS